MTKFPVLILVMATVCLMHAGCRHAGGRESDSLTPEPAAADATETALRWVDSVARGMTLEQMAGQLFLPAVYSDASPASLRSIASYAADFHVGGVVLLKGNVEAAQAVADTLRSLSAAPPFIAIDAEWGLAMRLKDTPSFPKNGSIAPDAEEDLMYAYGGEIARECRAVGINMVLGPVLDVLPGAAADRGEAMIGRRSFGSDPKRVAALGVAYARGLEDGGVVSVAKHFPGHGAADADSHRRLPKVVKSLGELRNADLIPFVDYIESGLSGVMTAHLAVPALDPSETPVSVSRRVVGGVLRDEMQFGGLVVTDAMNMAGADGYTCADAVVAGADIVLAPADTRKEINKVVEAVRSGRLGAEELRTHVRRILFFKYFTASPDHSPISTAETVRIGELLSGKGNILH